MYDIAKKARAANRAKAMKLADRPVERVDSADWTPPPLLKADVKTGMRPVSRRAYKSGGKVSGTVAPVRADRKKRKAGGSTEQPIVDRYVNRDMKKANDYRDGEKHIGGMKKGGRAKKENGGGTGANRFFDPMYGLSDEQKAMVKKGVDPFGADRMLHLKESKPKATEQVPLPRRSTASEIDNMNAMGKSGMKKGGRAKKMDGGPMTDPRLSIVKNKALEFAQNTPTPGLKKGGKVKHSDVAEDKALIKQMVKGKALKNAKCGGGRAERNAGGRIGKLGGGGLGGLGSLGGAGAKPVPNAVNAMPKPGAPTGMAMGSNPALGGVTGKMPAMPVQPLGQAFSATAGSYSNPGEYERARAAYNMSNIPAMPGQPLGGSNPSGLNPVMDYNPMGPGGGGMGFGALDGPDLRGGGRGGMGFGALDGPDLRGGGLGPNTGKFTGMFGGLKPVQDYAAPPPDFMMGGYRDYVKGAKLAGDNNPMTRENFRNYRDQLRNPFFGKGQPVQDYAPPPYQPAFQNPSFGGFMGLNPTPMNPFRSGGRVGKAGGGALEDGHRKGGAAKKRGGTQVNIIIGKGQDQQNPAQMMQGQQMPPMAPPPMLPMGGQPPMPPMGAGAPPMPPMGGGGQPPMPFKSGGRVTKVARSYKDMEAGAGSGEGRLQKTDIAKRNPKPKFDEGFNPYEGRGYPNKVLGATGGRTARKEGGKVYRSYKDMDAGAGSGKGRLEKTEIESRKK